MKTLIFVIFLMSCDVIGICTNHTHDVLTWQKECEDAIVVVFVLCVINDVANVIWKLYKRLR